jgi:hypothetical protein
VLAVGHGGPPVRWWRNLAAGEPDVPTLTHDEHPHSTSTLTHLQVGDRDAQRPLAIESRRAEELRRGTVAVENENVTLPKRDWLRGVVGEVAASRRSCGRVFGGGSVVESAHELTRVEAGAVLGRSARWRREQKREGVVARVRAETIVVATLKAWWPDGWDHGRRTAATVRPRINDGLWPVGHDSHGRSLTRLNRRLKRWLTERF